MEISGRAALVTGASRGLGAELARVLAARGARVVLAARGEKELQGVVDGIRGRGGRAWGIPADIGDPAAATALAGAASALAGPVDILVHNASTLGPVPLRLLLDTPPEDFARTLEVNVAGVFRLSQRILGSMALRRRGVVVHVSSDAAREAYPRWGAYGVSKAALEHLARIQAAELEGSGVSVLIVDPGEMRTQMHADAMPEADPSTLADPAGVAQRIADLVARAEDHAPGARLSA